MKIGFLVNPRKDIYSEIKWIVENGFDFVDLFLEPDRNIIENLDPMKIIEIIKECNIETVGHTAWYLPIGSPMKQLRDEAVSIINDYIVFFSKINCCKMTIHANWPPSMFNNDEGINFQTESIQKILDFSKNFNIRIMYEPIDTINDSIENVGKILDLNKELFFHLDTGHANLFKRNPIDYIRKFKDKLIHVHLHDNDGKSDLHLPIGTGIIKWKDIIDELKAFYKETVTLEIFSQDRDYVLLSKKKIDEYLKGLH